MPKISKIHDNIVTIEGSYKYEQDQYFKLSKTASGVVLSATESKAEVLVVGDPSSLKAKTPVSVIKSPIQTVPVFSNYFGSIITPFGEVIHGEKKSGKKIAEGKLDNNPPQLLNRIGLSEPLETGILAIDTMIPIGKGQRELIIGDRNTGKTSIALNAIINQKDTNVKSIYVAVGQKRNSVMDVYTKLKEHKALENTIVIFANPDAVAEQFFAPKIGMAMAEALAYKGDDVLIVVDDLTKHANVYREISLSIGKNPGREAYPTDIFYQASHLLERAGRFDKTFKNGSITCLPIVETVQGDIASLIPSNVISITDGQIFTSADMFNNGEFPSINIGLSVSRTGSTVQGKELKQVSKGFKARYSALYDIKKFAEMSIDISEELKSKIEDWEGINNILLQYGYDGYDASHIAILVELFKRRALGKIMDRTMFSVAFLNYCRLDEAAKKIYDDLKKGLYVDKTKKFKKDVMAIFGPLAKSASGIETDIVSAKEYAEIKGGN